MSHSSTPRSLVIATQPDSDSLGRDRAATPWRVQAARIVEELFPDVATEQWNLLIDLRQGLLLGEKWEEVLDEFQLCRDALEEDHYLVFYRLRRMLESHLRLEVTVPGESTARHQVLRLWAYRNLAKSLKRTSAVWSGPDQGTRCRIVECSASVSL